MNRLGGGNFWLLISRVCLQCKVEFLSGLVGLGPKFCWSDPPRTSFGNREAGLQYVRLLAKSLGEPPFQGCAVVASNLREKTYLLSYIVPHLRDDDVASQ